MNTETVTDQVSIFRHIQWLEFLQRYHFLQFLNTPLPHTNSAFEDHTVPSHAVWSGLSLNPVLQLAHLEAPSLGHLAPDDEMPLGHEHVLATQPALFWLTLQPVLQLDTSHPEM